jgi:hypothetical protein
VPAESAEIDSSHELAKTMLERVREETVVRQRSQKIEQYLRHAQESLDSSQYAETLIFLDEILRLDPRHEAARQLKQTAVERHERDLRIARHLEKAEKCAAAGDPAPEELDAVLSLDRQHQTALRMSGWLEQGWRKSPAAAGGGIGGRGENLRDPVAMIARPEETHSLPNRRRGICLLTTDDAGPYTKAAAKPAMRDPATVTTDDAGPYTRAVAPPPSEETRFMPPPSAMPEPPAPAPPKAAAPPPPSSPKPTPPPARPAPPPSPKPAPTPPRPAPPRPSVGQAPELRPERWVAPEEKSLSVV